MNLTYQDRIYRSDLQSNRDKVYVFGDNISRIGFGGQAKECRGEPNALGIVTKFSPREYLNDDRYFDWFHVFESDFLALKLIIDMNIPIVFPSYGIGTGLADVKNKAPRCWNRMEMMFDRLKIENPYKT